jgi:RecA-family ATPase
MFMDTWRVVVLGDGGVGKSALAIQVGVTLVSPATYPLIWGWQFTLNCFVG